MKDEEIEKMDNQDGRRSRNELAEERTAQAYERTEWAQHRTVLANERTFNAWLRTGLAAIGGGVAVSELLSGSRSILARIAGILLMLTGTGVTVLALWRYESLSAVMKKKGLQVLPFWSAWFLVGGVLAATFLVFLLFVLK